MADIWTPPRSPSVDASETETARTISNRFGDGYIQDTPDGYNSYQAQLELTFEGTPSDIDNIQYFLRTHVGTPFWYFIPGDSQQRQWVAPKWVRTRRSIAWHTIQVSLEQRFDIP